MKDYIYDRVVKCANFILQNNATIRNTAKVFCMSKSTIHKDVSQRLLQIDKALYKKVKLVLDNNLAQRHIRGGMATKQKYKKQTK